MDTAMGLECPLKTINMLSLCMRRKSEKKLILFGVSAVMACSMSFHAITAPAVDETKTIEVSMEDVIDMPSTSPAIPPLFSSFKQKKSHRPTP